jgi:hypothetical protein
MSVSPRHDIISSTRASISLYPYSSTAPSMGQTVVSSIAMLSLIKLCGVIEN